jgi:hypothetical protein
MGPGINTYLLVLDKYIWKSSGQEIYIYISYPQRGNYSDVVGSHILKLLNKGEYIKNIILI